jgi:acylphosphatase
MGGLDVVRRRVFVRGDVQGVFFRDSARSEAQSRGVGGWVRNCSDGSVEAMFEGSADAVDALVEWCRSGPSRASVENVSVSEEEPSGGESGFEVR